MGPTFDDITVNGLNQVIQPFQELMERDDALQMIYQSYAMRFNKSKEEAKEILEKKYPLHHKMAKLPTCAVLLFNSEGVAPGVLIPKEFTNGITEIISLPGVPQELQAIFIQHVLPRIRNLTKDLHFYQCGFSFINLGESRFTELIYSIKDEYPGIWIKTHPRSKMIDGKRRYEVEVHLTSFSQDNSIPSNMNQLYYILKEHVLDSGGVILKENPISKNNI